jgi:hypothetical protein
MNNKAQVKFCVHQDDGLVLETDLKDIVDAGFGDGSQDAKALYKGAWYPVHKHPLWATWVEQKYVNSRPAYTTEEWMKQGLSEITRISQEAGEDD